MKHLLALLLLSTASLFADGAILSMETQASWQRINGRGEISCSTTRKGINIFTVRGTANYRSKDTIEISPDKFYKLSGDFKAASGTEPAAIYFGVIPYDMDMVRIESGQVNAVPDSGTVLASAAKAGDKVLRIKDALKWKKGGSFLVAFETADDFSDLPNRSIIGISNIVKAGAEYEITLKQPLAKSYPAGCQVRQHQTGSTYPYNAAAKKVSGKWQTFSVLINGEALYGLPHVKWWHGTRNAGIIMLVNYGGNEASEMQIRNVVLEELTR